MPPLGAMRGFHQTRTITAMSSYWSIGLLVVVLACVYFTARLLRSADETERERHEVRTERWTDTADPRQQSSDSIETAPAVLSPPEDHVFTEPGRRRSG